MNSTPSLNSVTPFYHSITSLLYSVTKGSDGVECDGVVYLQYSTIY